MMVISYITQKQGSLNIYLLFEANRKKKVNVLFLQIEVEHTLHYGSPHKLLTLQNFVKCSKYSMVWLQYTGLEQ